MVPGKRGRVPEPGPPGLEGFGTRSTPTCIRTTPRSGQSRESAKAGGPADTGIEAPGADPFGDCQVEGSRIGALRACGNLDAALSRAEAASRERPADTLIKAVHLPVRRAAVELPGNRPANAVMLLEEARAFEPLYHAAWRT
jgi:hypothetical protein